MLLHDRIKFAVATVGVAISVLLVLVQVGVYFGFMESASGLIDHSDADVWVTAKGNDNFDFAAPMSDRAVYRIAEVPGVAKVEKVVLAFGQLKNDRGDAEGVQILGLEPHATMLKPWDLVAGDADDIAQSDGILVDETEYAKLHIDHVGQRAEVTGVRARVVGLTHGIRSFTTSPFVWTNLVSARAYSNLNHDSVTYVLVKAAPGTDPIELRSRLSQLSHLDAFTKAELSSRTRAYWSERTGIAAGIFTTTLIGVIVGIVVVGQILYSGTLEHLKEYGTLKAMGGANLEIVRVIFYQAIFSAALGFVVGATLSFGAKHVMTAKNLSVVFSPGLIATTAVMTVMMCVGAAMLSVVKVLRLDPASVFKG
jgi:putative ABC transport system permease protein